jgi:hypothetical protein
MKLYLAEMALVAIVATGVSLIGGYFIGKRAADDYYHTHPYIPRLSEVMDPKIERVLDCQFDDEPILGDYVTPSEVIPGRCHDSGNVYVNGVIGEVVEFEETCCPTGWVGRVRMQTSDSSN